MADREMLGAAALFATTTALGTVVGIREGIPAEPFRQSYPGTVAHQVLVGHGTGTAAPWAMPLVTVGAALVRRGRWPGAVAALVGAAVAVGTLGEPVTWGQRSHAAAARATVVLNLASALALVVTGARRAFRARRDAS